MPHKVKKLVVAGPKDSGKTSWSNIFHRIIPSSAIASLTQEKQFSAAMITNETQLVIVDEWSANTMESDLAKSILQGGWMVTAVKHGKPRTVFNNSPYYITTNHVPDFGDDDENVRRRVDIFITESLPHPRPGMNRWLYDHAMDCAAWMAEEISVKRHLIPESDLWYEGTTSEPLTVSANEREMLLDQARLRHITEADLRPENVDEQNQPVIHQTFATEFQLHQTRRKRRGARQTISSDSSDREIDGSAEVRSDPASSTSLMQESLTQRPPVRVDTAQYSPQPSDEGDVNEPPQTEQQQPSTSVTMAETLGGAELAELGEQENDNGRPPELPEINSMNAETPPGGWTLNEPNYMARVAGLIEYGLIDCVTKAHVHSFLERLRKAELRRSKEEQDFWTTPDPWIDAWKLLTGRKREVFDITAFVNHHQGISRSFQSLRTAANLRVLSGSHRDGKAKKASLWRDKPN